MTGPGGPTPEEPKDEDEVVTDTGPADSPAPESEAAAVDDAEVAADEAVAPAPPTDQADASRIKPEFVGDEGSASDEAVGSEPKSKRPKRSNGMTIALVGAGSLLVLALVAFILVSQRADDTPAAGSSPTTVPADQLVEFNDPEFGISLQYPNTWTRLDVGPGTRRLVLQEAGNNGMWVSALGFPADATDLKTFARQTIIQGSPTAQIAADPDITLNGVPGFYFLYTFIDDTTGLAAVHAHYFLLRDGEMLALVFQAAPGSFERLAGTFDQIADSLRLSAPTAPPATATPSSTTTTP